jgi:hypothetical protein
MKIAGEELEIWSWYHGDFRTAVYSGVLVLAVCPRASVLDLRTPVLEPRHIREMWEPLLGSHAATRLEGLLIKPFIPRCNSVGMVGIKYY